MALPPTPSAENGSIAQTLVDNVVDYAIYFFDLDGMVKSWNADAAHQGHSAEETIGRNFSVFFTDDDVRAGEPVRSLAIAQATGRFASEGWRVRKDRTRLWASVIIDAVRDPAGEVVGFAKVTRDITQSAAVQYLTEQLRLEREQFFVAKKIADEAAAQAFVSAERDRMTAAKMLERVVKSGFEVFIVKALQVVTDSNEWTYIRKAGTRFPVSRARRVHDESPPPSAQGAAARTGKRTAVKIAANAMDKADQQRPLHRLPDITQVQ